MLAFSIRKQARDDLRPPEGGEEPAAGSSPLEGEGQVSHGPAGVLATPELEAGAPATVVPLGPVVVLMTLLLGWVPGGVLRGAGAGGTGGRGAGRRDREFGHRGLGGDGDERRPNQVQDAEGGRFRLAKHRWLRLAHHRGVHRVLPHGCPTVSCLRSHGNTFPRAAQTPTSTSSSTPPAPAATTAAVCRLPTHSPHVVALGEVEEVAVEGLEFPTHVPSQLGQLVSHGRDLLLPLHVEGRQHAGRLLKSLQGLRSSGFCGGRPWRERHAVTSRRRGWH